MTGLLTSNSSGNRPAGSIQPPAQELPVVVIPCLNEAANIGKLVAQVVASGCVCVVADAASRDGSADLASAAGAVVVGNARGRARQMNAGATKALALQPETPFLFFLHADSQLPANWLDQARVCAPGAWGRFDVLLRSERITGWRGGLLKTIGWFMNERSALTGICTGDQGLIVSTQAWTKLGGFPDIPLMEDIEGSRQLKALVGAPHRLAGPIVVSAKRWEQNGVVRTMLHMWSLRLRWFFGESAESIARRYYPGARRG